MDILLTNIRIRIHIQWICKSEYHILKKGCRFRAKIIRTIYTSTDSLAQVALTMQHWMFGFMQWLWSLVLSIGDITI
jgi:DNA-directed RNA polymerase subunit E'/Rpb7